MPCPPAKPERGGSISIKNAGEVALLSSGRLMISSLPLQRELTPASLLRRRHSYADRDTDTNGVLHPIASHTVQPIRSLQTSPRSPPCFLL